ncbi:MAG: translational GTPase TypA [Bacteriovoracaceae bacterium]|nr:translational GTPase TypA [Bacteriovoracaceae bacterium]
MVPSFSRLKNLAIVAHVDHGKTTLVDGLLRQSGAFSERAELVDRVMDSGDLEKERGITIKAKNCAVYWKDTKINLLDTPGHADFGGEVERSLMMVDGVILLVDAAEGPLPQTRFVLQKAMERNIKIAVVINKIDRSDERTEEVKKEVEDLLIELATSLNMDNFDLELPFLYACAKLGWSTNDPKVKGENLHLILDLMVSDFFPTPPINPGNGLQILVTNLSYSPYLGPLFIGRIQRGMIKKLGQYTWVGEKKQANFKVTAVNVFDSLKQEEVEEAHAGEIIIVAGLESAQIGDSICSTDNVEPLERIYVDPPTVSVQVSVSTSPFSGKDGEYLTSRKLEEFLIEACRLNVSLKYEQTEDPKVFILKGRGELQLAIFFEELRRKGFEFMFSRPEVVLKKDEAGQTLEPFEKVSLDIPTEFIGAVTEKLAIRKGKMENMFPLGEGRTRLEFSIPSRGLIGYRTLFLTDTKGSGLMSSYFTGYQPFLGSMLSRQNGALISDRTGKTTPYALYNLLSSGKQFVRPGEDVYEGMVIGESTRSNDLNLNVCREKHLTSVRTAGKDENIILPPIPDRTLDWALDWIEDDEWVEVTPKNIRIRKRDLKQGDRSVIRK